MMSPSERLVYMANQIARNLEVQGIDAASRQVADHILAFWDPRMKSQLLEMENPALGDVAAEALRIVRKEVSASPGHSAAPIGPGGSDAG